MMQHSVTQHAVARPSALLNPHAGFVTRAIAFVIDIVLMSLLVGGAIAFIEAILGFFTLFGVLSRSATVSGLLGAVVAAVITLIGIAIAIGYPVGFWVLLGQTPGKIFVGVSVVRMDGKRLTVRRALLRYLGYWVSALPLFLGFLWILGDDQRQGWHDKIAGTCVVYTWQHHPAQRPLA
jgi:uncharacterized RDD family membrane protein YckC